MLKKMVLLSFNAEIFGFSAGKIGLRCVRIPRKQLQTLTFLFPTKAYFNIVHITMSLANFMTGSCQNIMFVKWYMLIAHRNGYLHCHSKIQKVPACP